MHRANGRGRMAINKNDVRTIILSQFFGSCVQKNTKNNYNKNNSRTLSIRQIKRDKKKTEIVRTVFYPEPMKSDDDHLLAAIVNIFHVIGRWSRQLNNICQFF